MLYCKIINGQIGEPEPLPSVHANISNFNLMDEEIVNSYGFYRLVTDDLPSYDPHFQKLTASLALEGSVIRKSYSVDTLTQEEQLQKINEMKLFFVAIVEEFLDSTVLAKDYKNVIHACSYVESSVPQYKAEALAVVAWRDLVWGKAYEIQNAILAGSRTVPTREEFLAEMPALEWPE